MPFVKWNVRVMDSVSYTPEHDGRKAVLSVTYKAEPFSELIFDALDGPCLDTEIPRHRTTDKTRRVFNIEWQWHI